MDLITYALCKNSSASAADAAAASASAAAQSAQAAQEAAQTALGIIDDEAVAADSTWSSDKISAEIETISPDDESVGTKPWSSKQIIDTLCLPMEATGNPVQCYYVAGYPLGVKASWEPRQEGEGDPSPDNVRQITGLDSVQVTRCGSNMFDFSKVVFSQGDVDIGIVSVDYAQKTITIAGNINNVGYTQSLRDVAGNVPAGTYVLDAETSSVNALRVIYILDSEKTIEFGTPALLTDEDLDSKFSWYNSSVNPEPNTISNIRFSVAGTDYAPYTGTTATLSLPSTVYGGEVDLATGEGVKTWEYIASYNGESIASEWISDRDVYLENATPTTGAAVVYKLATPQPIQATGSQSLPALSGENVLITNADSLTVTGRADQNHTLIPGVTALAEDVSVLKDDITYINNSVLTQSKESWCPNGVDREVYTTSTFSGFATSWEIAKEIYVKDLNFKVRSRADANITEIRVRIENADFAFEKSFIVDIGHELTDVKIEVDRIIPGGVVWIGIASNQICTFAHDADTDKHYTYWTHGALDELSRLKETGGVTCSLYLIASVSSVKFIDKVKTEDVIDGAITQKKLSFAEYKPPKNLFNYTSEEACKIGYWYYSKIIGSVLKAEKSIYTESTYTAIKVDVSSIESIVIDSPDRQSKLDIMYIGAVDEQMHLIDYIFERKTCPITYEIPSSTNYILLSALTVSEDALAALMVSKNGENTHYIPYQKPYYYLNDCKTDAETPAEIPIIQTIVGADENTVKLCVPNQYALVTDDTFELFYKGIINASNYKMFDVVIECKKGNAYHNKFVITPDIVEDLTLGLTLYGINHNVLDKKNILLKVMNKAASPVSSKNVLCVGDSLTTGGDWVKEFNRRLTATDGTPVGDGLNNINFVGSREIGGVHYEGYGGWTFASYNTESVNTNVQIITCAHNKTSDDQHSIYRDTTGNTWKLETILENEIKIIAVSSEGRNFPASGTLTWVSGGVNHESIEYSASTVAPGNPFWNETTGMVDFASYATKQSITDIDYVYVLLGWNSAFATEDVYKSDVRTFINNILSAFPSCKIVLMGLQIPARDGLGVNYGATGIYSRYYDLMQHVWQLDKWYADIASEYADNVSCISIAGQFDTENNMFESTRPVNVRNSKTETYQTNGVHPALAGYMQIADAAYRDFVHKLWSESQGELPEKSLTT